MFTTRVRNDMKKNHPNRQIQPVRICEMKEITYLPQGTEMTPDPRANANDLRGSKWGDKGKKRKELGVG